MNEKQNMDVYVKSAESAFSVMGAVIILFMACMVLLPSDVTMMGMDSGTQVAWILKNIVGFFFLYVSTMMIQSEWIELIKKIPLIYSFVEKRSRFTTPIIAVGLFVVLMILKLIFTYVPFMGYIFSSLLVFWYFYLMKKMSQSKSGIVKALFVVMMLIVLLVLLTIAAFFYLTREG